MHQAFEVLSTRVEARSPIDVDGTQFTLHLTEIREADEHTVGVIVEAHSDAELHTGESIVAGNAWMIPAPSHAPSSRPWSASSEGICRRARARWCDCTNASSFSTHLRTTEALVCASAF